MIHKVSGALSGWSNSIFGVFVLILNAQTSRCILAADAQFTSIIASTLSYKICCCEVPNHPRLDFLISNESLEIGLNAELKIFVPEPIKSSGQEDMSQNSRFYIVKFWICSQNAFWGLWPISGVAIALT